MGATLQDTLLRAGIIFATFIIAVPVAYFLVCLFLSPWLMMARGTRLVHWITGLIYGAVLFAGFWGSLWLCNHFFPSQFKSDPGAPWWAFVLSGLFIVRNDLQRIQLARQKAAPLEETDPGLGERMESDERLKFRIGVVAFAAGLAFALASTGDLQRGKRKVHALYEATFMRGIHDDQLIYPELKGLYREMLPGWSSFLVNKRVLELRGWASKCCKYDRFGDLDTVVDAENMLISAVLRSEGWQFHYGEQNGQGHWIKEGTQQEYPHMPMITFGDSSEIAVSTNTLTLIRSISKGRYRPRLTHREGNGWEIEMLCSGENTDLPPIDPMWRKRFDGLEEFLP